MFAITTRNKLRSRRHALSMIMAWVRIRRQLYRTPGMVAYTTGMASLTEFYTLTLWDKEIDMMAFMSSDDHREMMWNVRHWSDSFWSMRWKPTRNEIGKWNERSFANENSVKTKFTYVGPGYLEMSGVPEKLRSVLKNITRQSEPEILESSAVICRIPTPSISDIFRLRKLMQPWQSDRTLLRFELAYGFGECKIIAAWEKNEKDKSTILLELIELNFPEAWAMRFNATDFEIGHWDNMRFRELATNGNNER